MKISVIIPAYNAEKYIIKALDSIKNQKYKNIELIVVNDGSTDKTKSIVEKFLKENTDIDSKYIEINNGGLANARNVGILHATGDYMCNLDADDFLDDNIFEEISKINQNFDICFYGWKDIEEYTYKVKSSYNEKFNYIEGSISGIDAAIKKLKKHIWICQGNAIYNLNMIKENKILNIKGINQGEDIYFITRALLHAKHVCCIKENSFNCLSRKDSMMHSDFNYTHLEVLDALTLLKKDIKTYDFLGEYKDEIIKLVDIEYFNSIMDISKKISRVYKCNEFDKAISEINKSIPSININYNSIKSNLSLKKKIESLVFIKSKLMYFYLSKFYDFYINKI